MNKLPPEDESDAQLRSILQEHFSSQNPPSELRASLIRKARLASDKKRKPLRSFILILPKNNVSGPV
jgi:hypothetical protein